MLFNPYMGEYMYLKPCQGNLQISEYNELGLDWNSAPRFLIPIRSPLHCPQIHNTSHLINVMIVYEDRDVRCKFYLLRNFPLRNATLWNKLLRWYLFEHSKFKSFKSKANHYSTYLQILHLFLASLMFITHTTFNKRLLFADFSLI